jgi:hypothetical protein
MPYPREIASRCANFRGASPFACVALEVGLVRRAQHAVRLVHAASDSVEQLCSTLAQPPYADLTHG